LDRSQHGPQFLRQEAVAKLVLAALLSGARLGHYRLGPFVIMANHVHVLLLPLVPPSRLLKSLKGFTARQANHNGGRASTKVSTRHAKARALQRPDAPTP
jgi:REP element-mobilizing transposase RayT